MGIDSEPLFTRCYGDDGAPLDPDSVVLRFAAGDPDGDRLVRLMDHRTDVSAGARTFDDAVMSTCDCARIWGHLDADEFRAWDALFSKVLAENPRVCSAEAHFYCSGAEVPFFVLMERTPERGPRGRVRVLHPTAAHCLFFRVDDDAGGWEFDAARYRSLRDSRPVLFHSAMDEYCDIMCLAATGRGYPR